jgi:hypothetical protein
MARSQLSLVEIGRRLTLPGLSPAQCLVYERILRGVCVACQGTPEPNRRRCAKCAAVNRQRVYVSNHGPAYRI